jgi:hypothetical protein
LLYYPLFKLCNCKYITDIEKLDGGNKISVDRFVALGFLTGPGAIAGLFWKKKHVRLLINNPYNNTEKLRLSNEYI